MRKPVLDWSTKDGKSIAVCGDVYLVLNTVKTGEFKGLWQYGVTDNYHADLEGMQCQAERRMKKHATDILNALKRTRAPRMTFTSTRGDAK